MLKWLTQTTPKEEKQKTTSEPNAVSKLIKKAAPSEVRT